MIPVGYIAKGGVATVKGGIATATAIKNSVATAVTAGAFETIAHAQQPSAPLGTPGKGAPDTKAAKGTAK